MALNLRIRVNTNEAAGIAKEKVYELCDLIPPLRKEIDWTPGKTLFGKDYVEILFKNGSRFDVVAAKESSRGKMTKIC